MIKERTGDKTTTIWMEISKNHGSDEKWQIKRFYTLTEVQLHSNAFGEFQVKNHPKILIRLSTSELKKQFISSKHDAVDGAGKIRVYINQSKADDDFYIQRFGKALLTKTVKLNVSKNKPQYTLGS